MNSYSVIQYRGGDVVMPNWGRLDIYITAGDMVVYNIYKAWNIRYE